MNDDIPEPAHVPANMSCVFRLDYPGWCCWWWRWEASSLKYSFRPQRVRRCAVHLLRTTPVHIQFNQGLQDSSRPILAAFRPSDGGAKLQVSSCISLACKSTFEVILRWDPLSKKYSRIHCKNLATPPASSSSSSSSSGNSRRQVGGWKIIRMTTYVNATKVISIQIRFQLNFDCRIFSLTPTSPTSSSYTTDEICKNYFNKLVLRLFWTATNDRVYTLKRATTWTGHFEWFADGWLDIEIRFHCVREEWSIQRMIYA